jgi:hypothetical protein
MFWFIACSEVESFLFEIGSMQSSGVHFCQEVAESSDCRNVFLTQKWEEHFTMKAFSKASLWESVQKTSSQLMEPPILRGGRCLQRIYSNQTQFVGRCLWSHFQ